MISFLQRRSLICWYRLVKPNIGQFRSIEDLEYEQKQRQLKNIQQINQQSLSWNKSFTTEKFISSVLSVSPQVADNITKKHLNFSAISPESLKHYTLERNFNDGKIQYPFLLEELQPDFPRLDTVPMHFSYKRGVTVIPDYEIDKRVAYVFNLPADVEKSQISEKVGLETIKNIKIQYCRLGTPAYAKIYFNQDDAVTNLILTGKNYVEIGGRICYVRTHFDKEKLELKNRRLVIQNLQEDEQDLIIRLSEYGKVVHFDYPTFISRRTSLQEVKEHYKNSPVLIKINHHLKNGTITSEYYPSMEETLNRQLSKSSKNINEYDSYYIEKKEHLTQIYQNRMRTAQEVDVYEGKQNEVSIKNMGYCIVTYSCPEQAQNCYFNLRFHHKIQLFDAAQTQEFQIDQSYRKRILRFIDAEYRRNQEETEKLPNQIEKERNQFISGLSLFQKLVDYQIQEKALREKISQGLEGEHTVMLSQFKTKMNQIKKGLNRVLGKSFEQMAEEELFGRKLPKLEETTNKIKVQQLPELDQEMKDILSSPKLRNITSKNIAQRNFHYKKIKSRSTSRRAREQAELEEGQEDIEEQGGQEEYGEGQMDEQYTGKRHFSTSKRRIVNFRPRTAMEQANYILRYGEFIRNTINQYMGVFAENRLKPNLQSPPTFLNPEGLKFSGGTQFITEDDLPKFLECMRDQEKAQTIYSDFCKDHQVFKSKSIPIEEFIDNVRNHNLQAIQKYADRGMVKEVFEIEQGQDVEEKVKYLNATVANFGQQFRVHEQEGKTVIVKIAKVDHIYPLDRVQIMQKERLKSQNELAQLSDEQWNIFNKYKNQMLQTGQIPAELRTAFNISSDKTLDDLFEQLYNECGITKKDIQTLVNMDNFTPEQLGEDAALQVELEKYRQKQRQTKASDFAKDPADIAVRDKEGYFKVSKFRQI